LGDFLFNAFACVFGIAIEELPTEAGTADCVSCVNGSIHSIVDARKLPRGIQQAGQITSLFFQDGIRE
jgi:hypothetical protein